MLLDLDDAHYKLYEGLNQYENNAFGYSWSSQTLAPSYTEYILSLFFNHDSDDVRIYRTSLRQKVTRQRASGQTSPKTVW
jgi:hypothetical protein